MNACLVVLAAVMIDQPGHLVGAEGTSGDVVSRCLTTEVRPDECRWLFAAEPALSAAPSDITCPTTPIGSGATVSGTLSQRTSCNVVIPTSFGSVNNIADVYSFTALAGVTVTATLDSKNDFFGLPYLAVLDTTGRIVKAVIGTTSIGNDALRATLVFLLPGGHQWRLLVSGLGGPFSTAIGDYTLRFTLTGGPPARRRAVRR